MATSEKMLINATESDELRIAITRNNQLIDLDIEVPGQEQKKYNIYRGVITSLEPSLNAVFVKYDANMRHGFLPLKEISKEYFLKDVGSPNDADIKDILKIGQPLVVQIEKEERGTKGAALTTFISLPGAFLVLMPNNPRAAGISRRLDDDKRNQLSDVLDQLQVPDGMGLIIRTAGEGRSKEELANDLERLLNYWNAIKQAATLEEGVYPIHQESDALMRAIRDNIRQDMTEIIIDDETAYNRCVQYINQINQNFAERIKLYQDKVPLFSRLNIEQQIESAFDREIQLPSGASLVIDQAEALIAIDINSGRATKGGDIEETALNINLEAAEEIARQLRIRDIGGLIVIDFIDMTPTRNQREVENRLRSALRFDKARIRIGKISQFGLLEMSRQRIRSSLYRASKIPCPCCSGQGYIRSVESQALAILRRIREEASHTTDSLHFQIQLPLELVAYLGNEKREQLKTIEKSYATKITLIPNKNLWSPNYQIKSVKLDSNNTSISYELIQSLEDKKAPRRVTKPSSEPAIAQFLSHGANTPVKKNQGGLIKRLWQKMFGSTEEQNSKARSLTKKRSKNRQYAKRNNQKNRTRNPHHKNSSGEYARRKNNSRKRYAQKSRHTGNSRTNGNNTRNQTTKETTTSPSGNTSDGK